MTTAVTQWKRWASPVGMAVIVAIGLFAAPAAGQGYRLNGLSSGCTEPGSSNSVHGNKFEPGSQVSIALGDSEIAATTAGDAGNADATFVIPANSPTGTTTLSLVGAGTDGPRTLAFELQVGNCTEGAQNAGNAATVSGGSGSLAFTGGDIGLTVGAAAAVAVVGGALVVAARKRHNTSTDASS